MERVLCAHLYIGRFNKAVLPREFQSGGAPLPAGMCGSVKMRLWAIEEYFPQIPGLGQIRRKIFFLVKKTHQPKAKKQAHQRHQQVASSVKSRIQKILNVSARESLAQLLKSPKNISNHVNRDRVHSHPDERLAPVLPFAHIHDPIEQAQQKRAVTARHQDK